MWSILTQIDPPEQKVETSKQELLEFHRKMWMMRRVELAADQLYKQVRCCDTSDGLPRRPSICSLGFGLQHS